MGCRSSRSCATHSVSLLQQPSCSHQRQLPSAFQILLVHSNSSNMRGLNGTARELKYHIELLSDDISLEQRSLFRFVVLRTKTSAQLVEIAFMRIPLENFEVRCVGAS